MERGTKDSQIISQIQVKDLSWKPEGKEKEILKQISITFEAGRIYGIIGPNGSGKTSLLRHILRFLKPERGEIELDQKQLKDYKRDELAKKISFVPQDTRVHTDFSAYDVVMMGRSPYQKRFMGISREDKKKVEAALEVVKMQERKDDIFPKLSGGEAQRVVIARAIAQDTEWMLLDEPVSNLDIRHQTELMKTLKELNQNKKISVILVLHDINLAASYCDRIVMMKHGRIWYAGETDEIMTVKNLEALYEIPFVTIKHPVTKRCCFLPA